MAEQVSENFVRADYRLPYCRPSLGLYLSNGVAESTNCVTGHKMAPHCYLCLYDCGTHSASYAHRLHVNRLLVLWFELRLEWPDKSQWIPHNIEFHKNWLMELSLADRRTDRCGDFNRWIFVTFCCESCRNAPQEVNYKVFVRFTARLLPTAAVA